MSLRFISQNLLSQEDSYSLKLHNSRIHHYSEWSLCIWIPWASPPQKSSRSWLPLATVFWQLCDLYRDRLQKKESNGGSDTGEFYLKLHMHGKSKTLNNMLIQRESGQFLASPWVIFSPSIPSTLAA